MKTQFTERSERKLLSEFDPAPSLWEDRAYSLKIGFKRLPAIGWVRGKFGQITYVRYRSISYVLTYV